MIFLNGCVRVKREDGVLVLVSSKRELEEVWKGHFEYLKNEKTAREAIM